LERLFGDGWRKPWEQRLCFRGVDTKPGCYRLRRLLCAGHFDPGESLGEAGLAHALEHLAHLSILPQQLVDFLNRRS
jgi:hypothetical protein